MRNKKLWKNLMLVTTLTVALGTVSATALAEDEVTLAGGTQVTAFASEGDIDGGIAVEAQAEQTAPEADTTVKDEVSTKATAPTINATASSTTFDGTQDIVVTFTVNGEAGTFHVYTDIPQLEGLGVAGAIEEKISDSEYRITIPAQKLKMLIDAGSIKEDQVVTLSSGYTAEGDGYDPVAFPKVSFTYTTGDNGDNGNGETPEKPENPDNGNGDNGDNNNGGQTPETPDNGNGQTPETPDNGNSNTNNQNNTQNNTNNNQTTAKPTTTSPKTGDATATLPVAGTGLASLGVALATVLRKRK